MPEGLAEITAHTASQSSRSTRIWDFHSLLLGVMAPPPVVVQC
ncbi:MAG: hypothetical protein OEW33_03415 [Nitrospirota bacterium]|nr:hypothetical protein [Nitrospirota bacterium]